MIHRLMKFEYTNSISRSSSGPPASHDGRQLKQPIPVSRAQGSAASAAAVQHPSSLSSVRKNFAPFAPFAAAISTLLRRGNKFSSKKIRANP